MNIYHLTRADPHGYDEAYGFVIIASDEQAARRMAAKRCGDEGGDVWLSIARCDRLGPAESHFVGIVLCDFRAG